MRLKTLLFAFAYSAVSLMHVVFYFCLETLSGKASRWNPAVFWEFSPGTVGFPPPARPALCPDWTGPCWGRPAPPAGLCTPGGRGQTPACSCCAPARLLSAGTRCGREDGSISFNLSQNYPRRSQIRLTRPGCLATCRSRCRPARLQTSCSPCRRSPARWRGAAVLHASFWAAPMSSRSPSCCCCKGPRSAGACQPQVCEAKNFKPLVY